MAAESSRAPSRQTRRPRRKHRTVAQRAVGLVLASRQDHHQRRRNLPEQLGKVVAANGDELFFTSNELTGSTTFTGGTGRFKGATGGVNGFERPDGPPTIDGGVVKLRLTWTLEGTITY